MFAKHKVSQSMIDAVNSVIENKTPEPQPVQQQEQHPPTQYVLDEASEKVATPTGMKVYGSSYGNSKKARQDQTKSSVDTLKGPKDKEVKEELKGDQHKIDANKNQKIDAQDFAILKAKKKMKEDMSFTDKLLETARRSDVPAYLRKAKGDAPLTPAEVKAPKKDTISAPENLAKARNEEVEKKSCEDEAKQEVKKHEKKMHKEESEQIDEKEMTASDKAERERLVKGMKKGLSGFKARYGARAKDVMYATATKQAMKEDAVDEATIAGTPGWEKVERNVKDKSGAVHTPMSRAKNLAQAAFKSVQSKTKIEKK